MGILVDLIKSRRSIRSYLLKEVSQEDVMQLLEAAIWAPSGKNIQPWKFAVIMDEKELKQKVSALTIYRRWVEKAPCLIIVFLDKNKSYDITKDIQAVGAAIQNILLTAHELGLGTCWIGEILRNEAELKKILKVPDHLELMAIITVGHTDNPNIQAKRNELCESLLFWK